MSKTKNYSVSFGNGTKNNKLIVRAKSINEAKMICRQYLFKNGFCGYTINNVEKFKYHEPECAIG